MEIQYDSIAVSSVGVSLGNFAVVLITDYEHVYYLFDLLIEKLETEK